jgi:hypothetical protein
LIPVVLLSTGYHFSNLPKLLILQLSSVAVAAVLLTLPVSRQPGISIPVLAFIVLSALQIIRSYNPFESAILLFVLTGSVTVGFGATQKLDDKSKSLIVRGLVYTAGLVCLVGVCEYWGFGWAQL